MPIYSYCCSACHCEKDILQKISDPLLTLCPTCGKHTLQKKITAASFQLKGSGWYVTDFRNPIQSKEKTENKKETEKKPSEATDTTIKKEATKTTHSPSTTKSQPLTSKATS